MCIEMCSFIFILIPSNAGPGSGGGSKAWVCGRSMGEIVGSNSTGGMDMSLVSVKC